MRETVHPIDRLMANKQEMRTVYNPLVGNALMLQTVADPTRALNR